MQKVGVEQSLSHIQEELQNRGYEVISLHEKSDIASCDFIVTTGQDSNMFGDAETRTAGSVINASGLTAEEVFQEIERRVH